MNRRHLGRQGLQVSELGLGCVGMSELYGPRELDESRAALQRALDLGLDFFDTSDVYGAGHNETFLGEALAARRAETITDANRFPTSSTTFSIFIPVSVGGPGSGRTPTDTLTSR